MRRTPGELESWSGDFDEIRSAREQLTDDAALCERVFASKHEAYLVGRAIADGEDSDADRAGPGLGAS